MTRPQEIATMGSVTDLHSGSRDVRVGALAASDTDRDAAVAVADAAARSAGVTVRELSALADLDQVYRLYDAIWRPDPTNPPVTTELLRALTKAGNYVAGAFDADRLVGACVGFFGAPADAAMHSHIAGVAAGVRGRSVGFALKLHQRAWALLRDVCAISWTFDPLVCRNAYFNLVKLAATPVEYLPNFYGGMRDEINGADDTDRLLVRWELTAATVSAACTGAGTTAARPTAHGSGTQIALGRSDEGQPVIGSADGPSLLVAVPADIEALRVADPHCAGRWRGALRDVLAPELARGARVTGFDRAGWYLIQRPVSVDGQRRSEP